MLQELIEDWPMGTIIAVIMFACVSAFFALIAWIIFKVIDSCFLARKHGVGRVVSKIFTPAHTQTILIYNAATKTSLPHPIFCPDNWSVSVEINGKQDNMSVSKEFFSLLSENDSVMTEYVSGRLSRSLYIKGLSCIQKKTNN